LLFNSIYNQGIELINKYFLKKGSSFYFYIDIEEEEICDRMIMLNKSNKDVIVE